MNHWHTPQQAHAASGTLPALKTKLLEELKIMRVSYHQSVKALHHKLFTQECLLKNITPAWLQLNIKPHFSGNNEETRAIFKSYFDEFTRKTLQLSVTHYRDLCKKNEIR